MNFVSQHLLVLLDPNSSNAKLKKVLKQNDKYFKFIKNPSYDLIEFFLKNCHVSNLIFIKNLNVKDPNLHKLVLKYKPAAFLYLKDVKDALIEEFLLMNPENIKYLKKHPNYLKYKNIAVSKNATVIYNIKNPSIELQERAINVHADLIFWIKKPHPSIINKAIKKDPKCIKYIKALTNKQKLMVLTLDPESIIYIKKPTVEMQRIVLAYMFEHNKSHLIFHLNSKLAKQYITGSVFI